MEEQAKDHPSHSSENDEARRLLDQGRLYYRQGELTEALSCLHLAYDQYEADGGPGQVAEVANDIGVVYTVLRRWSEAEKWLDEAQRLFVKVGDYDGEAQTLGNMGSMFRAKGDLRQAAANLQLSAGRLHLVGDDERRAATLKALSVVRLRQFRFLQAVAAYQAALECHPNPTLLHRLLQAFLSLPLRMMQR